ncbi:hypothetical protein E2C01_016912 [Portunus trituberculatus]|uniref:Uncharacterized protein n=1 Tax=Portunus trituberculatus TaxID=210409 RepID=A0A5B7DRH4_PORTR|nr:hypothetical protein [Portunus trituberculatus]
MRREKEASCKKGNTDPATVRIEGRESVTPLPSQTPGQRACDTHHHMPLRHTQGLHYVFLLRH